MVVDVVRYGSVVMVAVGGVVVNYCGGDCGELL